MNACVGSVASFLFSSPITISPINMAMTDGNQSITQHLEALLVQGQGRVRLVVLTTPGNPTGAICHLPLQRRILELCRR